MNIGVVGLGLMGGSFARTILKKCPENKIFAYDLSKEVLDKAYMLGAYNEVLTVENAKELDILVISVYPQSFSECLEKYLPHLKNGVIIIDFCGVKRPIIQAMKKYQEKYPNYVFVGGHPMAGREYSGIERSITTLFDKASMIFVPLHTDIFSLDFLKNFFLQLGFQEIVFTTAEKHDEMIAYTSQLCHVVSNAFIKSQTASEHFGYSAGSYKDLTRVAKLNPSMWTELMLNNADKLSLELSTLIDNLAKYKDAIETGDKDKLFQLLKEGNERKILIDKRSNSSENRS